MSTGFDKMVFGSGLDQHDLNVEDKSLIGIGKWGSGKCDLEQLL